MKLLILIFLIFNINKIDSKKSFNCCIKNYIQNKNDSIIKPIELKKNLLEINSDENFIKLKIEQEVRFKDENIELFLSVNRTTDDVFKFFKIKFKNKDYYILKSEISGATKYNMFLNTYLILDPISKKTYHMLSLGDIKTVFRVDKKTNSLNIYEYSYSDKFYKNETIPNIKVSKINIKTSNKVIIEKSFSNCNCY